MDYREHIFSLIKKLFVSGYLDIIYGQIRTPGPNTHIEYPLTKEETEEVICYFGKEQEVEVE